MALYSSLERARKMGAEENPVLGTNRPKKRPSGGCYRKESILGTLGKEERGDQGVGVGLRYRGLESVHCVMAWELLFSSWESGKIISHLAVTPPNTWNMPIGCLHFLLESILISFSELWKIKSFLSVYSVPDIVPNVFTHSSSLTPECSLVRWMAVSSVHRWGLTNEIQ